MQHAPVKYSDLSKDSTKASNLYLGAAEYKPAVPEPKMKLCSTTTLEKTFANKSQRKTPKILRIIATVDDKQDKREAEGVTWEFCGGIVCKSISVQQYMMH